VQQIQTQSSTEEAAMPHRWSDNDRYFGPFTYARDTRPNGYRPFSVLFVSDDDEGSGPCIRLCARGHTLITSLPRNFLKPQRVRIIATSWDKETCDRLGRNWYEEVYQRIYGFICNDGFLEFLYGAQTNSSDTTKSWSIFLPWKDTRHVRHTIYNLDGSVFWEEFDKDASNRLENFRHRQMVEKVSPGFVFEFEDFDGEIITARTFVEEQEWQKGSGKFKWISFFSKPIISRSMSIEFSKETGKRKGSWKGGTIGHSINLLSNVESQESAFMRYCEENGMKYRKIIRVIE
jgi:hypothetical protein